MPNIIKANIDDLVFRSRNKEYGAYVLRKILTRNTLQAFLISLAGVALLLILLAIPKDDEDEAVEDLMATEIELEEPPPLNEEEEIPEEIQEVEPPPPPKRSQVKFVPPEVVEAEEADPEATVVDVDTVDADIGTEDIEGDDDAPPEILDIDEIGDGDGPAEIAPPPSNEDPPDEFVFLEEQPSPVNLDEIRAAVKYPQMAKDAGIYGKVVFRVLIDENGRYKKHKVLKTPHPWLTEACVKHLNKIRFTPGIQAGKPIPVWVTVPFDFKIQR